MEDTTIKVLQRNDPSFEQSHYDFDFLRSEGLKYIGELSGKIWTDHNTHDPGITILEMLAYALLDLGYRTQLPIQDILADPDGAATDSYFTPAQILGNNPTTILDYRKLLIEIEGVQNAWLEPYLEESYHVCYNKNRANRQDKYRIKCQPLPTDCENSETFILNGLYCVIIQTEIGVDQAAIREKVLDRLHQHRNLCEDFAQIKFLCEEEISICADVEIAANFVPEAVYVQILQAIESFLSPSVRFYTLQEMLKDKGYSIEEIFVGRPFSPQYDSPGFIDTTELAAIKRRKEIHLSDLYSLIHAVEGVKAVRKLEINGRTASGAHRSETAFDEECKEWVFHLAQDHTPIFNPESSCISLVRDGAVFQLDQFEVQRIKNQNLRLRSSGRAKGDISYLDIPIPKGNYRADLGTYYSIQNEFPSVYGVGEGDLPGNATELRKAQALQLKGYLLFFDQLLVNYLEQLVNTRNLFSFQSDNNSISGGNNLASVPELERILQIYNEASLGTVQLIPIGLSEFQTTIRPSLSSESPLHHRFAGEQFKTNTRLRRDMEIEQLVREFRQENYTVEIYPTENCFYFTIQPHSLPIVILARTIYSTEEEARVAANNISYIGTKVENYQRVNLPADQEYSFELVFRPSSNLSLTDELTQTVQSKLDRRNLILDHLLARFSEAFTDYSIMLFEQVRDRESASRDLIQAKTNYLTNYPSISANRGKAFDYRDQESVWNSANISGLERKLLALSGADVGDWNRKYLCNFEVHKNGLEFQVIFQYAGKTIFQARNTYDSYEKALDACSVILREAQDNSFYEKLDLVDCFQIVFNSSKYILPLEFTTREERDLCYNAIRNLFHQQAAADYANVYPSQSVFQLELYNAANELMATSQNTFSTKAEAEGQQKSFIRKIKEQRPAHVEIDLKALSLTHKAMSSGEVILDFAKIKNRVKIADSDYLWLITGLDGKPILQSATYWANRSLAFNDYLKTIFVEGASWKVNEATVQLISRRGRVLASQKINSQTEAELIIKDASPWLDPDRISKEFLKEVGKSFGFEVRNSANRLLLESVVLYKNKNLVRNVIEHLDVKRYAAITNEEGLYLLHFHDEKGRLIASTREAVANPEALLAQVASNMDSLEIVEIRQSYTFKVLKDGEEILEGFTRYRSEEKAYGALFQFVADFQAKRLNYRKIGEVELDGIELYLVDKQGGQFLAFSPKENFRKPEFATREQTLITKYLNQWEFPIDYLSASKYYLVDQQGTELLRSSHYYSSPNAARNAGRKALVLLGLTQNVEEALRPAQTPNAWVFQLEDEAEGIVASTIIGDRTELHEQLVNLKEEIQKETYQVAINSFPKRWKHRFFWINTKGEAEVLYESKKEYKNAVQAKVAYEAFLKNKLEVSYEKIGAAPKFGLKMQQDNQALEHPRIYKTAAERDEAIQTITKLFTHFNDPECGENTITLTKRSRDTESYVYRVFKKGDPIAFHPCQCFEESSLQDLSQAYRDRLESLCEQKYDYPALCLAGGKMICKIAGRYHYVIRDKNTDAIYFTSWVSYPTQKEAVEAFGKQYLQLIHYASDVANYLEVTLEDGSSAYYLGAREETKVATFTEEIFNDRVNIAQRFLAFPIRLVAKRLGELCFEDEISCYYFHLLGAQTACNIDWLSACCYETAEETWAAYRHFRYLLENKSNYRPFLSAYLKSWWEEHKEIDVVYPQDSACCYFLSINEVLAESCVEYLDEASAWGREKVKATYVGATYTSLEQANEGFGVFLQIPYTFSIKSRATATRDQAYYYEVWFGNTRVFVGEQLFDKEEEANAEAVRLFTFFPVGSDTFSRFKANLRIILDQDCLYRIVLVDPNEEPHKIGLVEKPQDQRQTRINQFHELKGLEKLLEATCQDDAFLPYIQGSGKNCTYSFKIIQPKEFYYAHHPLQYHTKEDRDRMIAWLEENIVGDNCRVEEKAGLFSLYVWLDKTTTEVDLLFNINQREPFNLRWATTPTGEGEKYCLFQFPEKFEGNAQEMQQVIACYQENFKRLVAAGHLSPVGDLLGNDLGIALSNPNGILALHPQQYRLKSELFAAIERTKNCIHTEGMHLLEHLLLRPECTTTLEVNGALVKQFDCSCTLLAAPNFDCQLSIPQEDIDPCLKPGKGGDSNMPGNEEQEDYYVPCLDPYSFIATAVFPYWSKRYKDLNFRAFITNTLYRKTPSHVALNLIWLDPQQLCKLEDEFRKWLRYKAQLTTCDSDMPCDLIECLLSLKNYCTRSPLTEEENCACDQVTVNFSFRNIALNNLVGNGSNFVSPILQASTTALSVSESQIHLSKAFINEELTPSTIARPLPSSIVLTDRPFLMNINSVDNKAILKSKTYQYISKLAEQLDENPFEAEHMVELEETIVPNALKFIKRSDTTPEKDEIIQKTLFNLIAFLLDKHLAANHHEVQYEEIWKRLMAKFKDRGLDASTILQIWNTKDLQQQAEKIPVITQYVKLLQG